MQSGAISNGLRSVHSTARYAVFAPFSRLDGGVLGWFLKNETQSPEGSKVRYLTQRTPRTQSEYHYIVFAYRGVFGIPRFTRQPIKLC
jgi:hypothetical protein